MYLILNFTRFNIKHFKHTQQCKAHKVKESGDDILEKKERREKNPNSVDTAHPCILEKTLNPAFLVFAFPSICYPLIL